MPKTTAASAAEGGCAQVCPKELYLIIYIRKTVPAKRTGSSSHA